MKPVDVRAHRIPSTGADDVPRLALAVPKGADVTVDGAMLEGAFETAAGTLLITTDDVPFEETVHLVLLADGTVRDQWDIGAPYTPGVVRNLSTNGNAAAFEFAGERFRVTVNARGRLVLPGASAAGVRRRTPPWRGAHILVEKVAE